jgi:hypothetical protein
MLSYIWVSLRRTIGIDGRFWVRFERVIHYHANVDPNG